jgi:hypothetical protein
VIIAKLENTIFEYEGKDNVIILPITQFVRKDGNLAVLSSVTKDVFEKYPILPKKWGYMISQGVPYPSYTISSSAFIGIPNKKHYASALDEELINSGIWYVLEEAMLKQEKIFYLVEEEFMNSEILIERYKNIDNIVLLKRKEFKNE